LRSFGGSTSTSFGWIFEKEKKEKKINREKGRGSKERGKRK